MLGVDTGSYSLRAWRGALQIFGRGAGASYEDIGTGEPWPEAKRTFPGARTCEKLRARLSCDDGHRDIRAA